MESAEWKSEVFGWSKQSIPGWFMQQDKREIKLSEPRFQQF